MNTDKEQGQNKNGSENVPAKEHFKAPALKPGARVGLFAPSSRPQSPLVLKRCVQIVEEMGFYPVVGKNVLKNDGFTAGTDEERIDDLHNFLHDPSIGALLCVSGGYGASRLLPLVEFAQIRRSPKIFLGGAENDSFLLAINEMTELVVFHGPNLDEVNDEYTFRSLKSALLKSEQEMIINCRDSGDQPFESARYSLSGQICNGVTCGGNLTSLSSLFGTRYQPQLLDKILILDDYAERNDILDRWFTTLYLAGSLTDVVGIAFGGFPGCASGDSHNNLSIEDMFGARLKQLETPACFGFKFGQSGKNNIVPVGVSARLDCSAGTLQMLESALA